MLGPITNIPLNIIEYWDRFLSKSEEINSYYINDVIYISSSVKEEFIEPNKIYANTILAKLTYGKVFIIFKNTIIFFF